MSYPGQFPGCRSRSHSSSVHLPHSPISNHTEVNTERPRNDGGADEECRQESQGEKCFFLATIKGPINFYQCSVRPQLFHPRPKIFYSLGELRPSPKPTITPCGFDAWDSFPNMIFVVGNWWEEGVPGYVFICFSPHSKLGSSTSGTHKIKV